MGYTRKILNHYGISRVLKLKPNYLFYSPTLKCPSRCSHCRIWEKGSEASSGHELTPLELKEILNDQFLKGIKHVWLTGGEPFARSDIVDVMNVFMDSPGNLKTLCIATSGLVPKRVSEIVEEYKQRHEDSIKSNTSQPYLWFHISLDGPSAEIHDKVRGVEGAFSKLEETVRIIRDTPREIRVGAAFNCVIQPANIDHLDEISYYARARAIPLAFNIVEVSEDNFYRNASPELNLDMDQEQRHKVSVFCETLALKSDEYHAAHYKNLVNILRKGKRTRRCVTVEETLYIDPDGSVFACPRAYSVQRQDILKIGPGPSHRAMLKLKPEIEEKFCPTCPLGCSFGEGLSIYEVLRLGVS